MGRIALLLLTACMNVGAWATSSPEVIRFPESRVFGRVTDEAGAPIAGATVALHNPMRGILHAQVEVVTDRDGRYEMRELLENCADVLPYLWGHIFNSGF